MDYIYEHFDEFRLLLDASYGTKFQNFVDRLVSVEEEYTWKWLEAAGSRLVRYAFHNFEMRYFRI